MRRQKRIWIERTEKMSLLTDFAVPCVLMEKRRVPDGAGGYITTWEEGAEFEIGRAHV